MGTGGAAGSAGGAGRAARAATGGIDGRERLRDHGRHAARAGRAALARQAAPNSTTTAPGLTCDPPIDTQQPVHLRRGGQPGRAAAGDRRAATPSPTTARVKIWRMQGNAPVQCGPVYRRTATRPGLRRVFAQRAVPGDRLAVGYVDVYRVPAFTFVARDPELDGRRSMASAGRPTARRCSRIDYDGGSRRRLYADRPDGTPITSSVLGVDPDTLAVSPVASIGGATTIAVGGYVGNAGRLHVQRQHLLGATIMTTASSAAAWGIGFSPDGQLLAVGTDDGIVRFWAAPFTTTRPAAPRSRSVRATRSTGSRSRPAGRTWRSPSVWRPTIWNVDDAHVRLAAHSTRDPGRHRQLRHLGRRSRPAAAR